MAEREPRPAPRSTAERGADHAAIDRLTEQLLPALIARLGASGLGELEVREGSWRVRLRRPPGVDRRQPGPRSAGRVRADDRSTRAGGDRAAREGGTTAAASAPVDPALPPMTAVVDPGPVDGPGPLVATSPAVGTFHVRDRVSIGDRVRAGDRLGSVDLLGVPVEVASPADGIVVGLLVDDGDAVEYGQALVALEPLPPASDRPAGAE